MANIDDLIEQQQQRANTLVSSDPQWCYLQGQIETLRELQDESKDDKLKVHTPKKGS